jgi:hypothetical protein
MQKLHHVRIQDCVQRCIGSGRKASSVGCLGCRRSGYGHFTGPRGFLCSRVQIEILNCYLLPHQPDKMSMKAVSIFY